MIKQGVQLEMSNPETGQTSQLNLLDQHSSEEKTIASHIPILMSLQELVSLPRNPRKSKKITINLTGTRYSVITNVARDYFTWNCVSNSKELSDDWNIQWYDTYITTDTLRYMYPFQKINHFPGSFELGRKNLLCKNLSKMKKLLPYEYGFFPKTWLLPYQFEDLKQYTQDNLEKGKKGKQCFIVKPEASCQGRGIYLTKKIDGLSQNDHCVVQEYITDPYLIDNLKFDLRIYALVKSVSPLKVFVYREGMARFATINYEKPKKKNMKNLCMHLTNYAVNKKNPDFVSNNDEDEDGIGHKRSFSSILRHIKDTGRDPEEVFKEICHVIVKTVISVQPHLSHIFRSCQPKEENFEMCFEVFGFDIMLDNNLKPWLLEVNHTPSFHTDATFDLLLKSNVILDTLNLVNVKSKSKKIYLENRVTPYLEKKFFKLSPEELRIMYEKIKAYEDKNCGGYFRIYPAPEVTVQPFYK